MKNWELRLENGFQPAWVKIIKEIFDQIATEHPQWQACELSMSIKHEFTQVTQVYIYCDNEAFKTYLIDQFGNVAVTRNDFKEYDNYPITHKLNRTCEWCGAPVTPGLKPGLGLCEKCSKLADEISCNERPRGTFNMIRNELGQWS